MLCITLLCSTCNRHMPYARPAAHLLAPRQHLSGDLDLTCELLCSAKQVPMQVLYTHQLPTYADPMLDRLDPEHTIQYRLYRCACRTS